MCLDKMSKQSEIECASDITNTVGETNNGQGNQKEPFNLIKSVEAAITNISVEPYLGLYVFATVFTVLSNQILLVEKACRAELGYSAEVCLKVVESDANDNITEVALKSSSIEVANLVSWKDPVQTAIPAIYILFIGAWSDRTGNRKAVLLIPVIGEFFALVGFMLSAYFMVELPIWVIGFFEITATAFTGGLAIALMGCYNYIADITTPDSRTFRMGVLVFVARATSLIASPIAGVLVYEITYIGLYGVAMVLRVICIIYTILRLRNERQVETTGNFFEKLRLFFHPKNVSDTVSILFDTRLIKLSQILVVVGVHLIVMGPIAGEDSVMFLYQLNRFQMGFVEFTLFKTWSTAVNVCGTLIAVSIFNKWLKFHDAVVALIATASNVLSSILYGVAPTRVWFYVGAVVDIFGSSGGAAIRSLGTKLVDQDKIGKMCSLLGLVDSMMPVLYIPLFNKVLTKVLADDFYLGTVYLLGAAVTAPAVPLLIYLYVLHRRQQRQVVKNAEIKEMHVYDNEVNDNVSYM